jgi:OmpA family
MKAALLLLLPFAPLAVEHHGFDGRPDCEEHEIVPLPAIWYAVGSIEPLQDTAWYLGVDGIRSAQDVLSFVKATMDENPTLILDVEGHADGTEADPSLLAQRRAEGIVTSLISLGLPAGRLKTVNKGAEQPLIVTSKIRVMKTEAEKDRARRTNRRVTFRIDSHNWKP